MQRHYYAGTKIQRALDIAELREMAHRRLPGFVLEYLEGGAEDESTLARNRDAFSDYRWVHRAPVDVSTRTLSTTILGAASALPFAIGPTGFNGMLWKHGDIELARAAKAHDIPFITSMVASDSLAAINKEAGGRVWFQVTILRDPEIVDSLVRRADEAGCEALFVTLDTPVLGNRSWNERRYAKPMHLTLRSKLDALMHLRWLFGVYLPGGLPGFGNLDEFLPPDQRDPLDGARFLATRAANAALTWDDLERLRARWPRKLVLKGLLAKEDVERAVQIGADGVVLSNHGGRQLDGEVAPLDVLPEIAAAFGDRIAILIDGGVRRGSDIAKALALGADAVLIGRATLYGLAAGGTPGAARAMTILKNELDRVLTLLGCPSVSDLGGRFLLDLNRRASPDRARLHA